MSSGTYGEWLDLDAVVGLIGPLDDASFDVPDGLPVTEPLSSGEEGYTVEFDEPDPFAPVPGLAEQGDDYLGINPQDLLDNWDAPIDLDPGL